MKTTLRRFIALGVILAAAGAHAHNHTVKLPKAVVDATGLTTDTITVATEYVEPFVEVSAVALLGSRGRYVVCEDNGGHDANADRKSIGRWETFIMLKFHDGRVAFRTTKGKFVTRSGDDVKCTASAAFAWERWQPIEQSDGTYAFRGSDARFMRVTTSNNLRVEGTAVVAEGKFEVIDLGFARMQAMPGLSLKFADLDGDAQREMILLIEEANGHGFFMIDPLGIVDLMGKLGYGTGQGLDIWSGLSVTQQTALRLQANSVGSYGNEIDATELANLLSRFGANASRTYISYQFEREIEGYAAGTCYGDLCTEVVIGNDRMMVEFDEFGPGFEMSTNVATLSLSNGVVSASVSVGTTAAAANIDKDGFTFGASLDLISVSVGLGKENGTYVGVSASVGVGFWGDAKYGKNGQYGFSLGVPFVPVGVALYIKGSDAAWVYNQVTGWTVDTAPTVADGVERGWALAMGWAAQSDDNIQIALTASSKVSATARRYADATLQIAGQTVVGGLSDGSAELVKIYDGAAHAVNTAVAPLTNAFDDVADNVPKAMKNAAKQVGNSVASVANNVADGFCGVFGC